MCRIGAAVPPPTAIQSACFVPLGPLINPRMDTRRQVALLLGAALTGAFITWLLLPRGHIARNPAPGVMHRNPQVPHAWILDIRVTFESVEDRDRWIEIWRPAGDYVRKSEGVALAYKVAISDQDPLQILVFERYTSKEDYLKVHRSSDAFWTFKKATKDSGIRVKMDGHSYDETDAGFM